MTEQQQERWGLYDGVQAPVNWGRGRVRHAWFEVEDMLQASPANVLRFTAEMEKWADMSKTAGVRTARDAGLTWQEIADALGITRQAAQKRWGYMERG
jgi:hypothetical protein